MSQQPVTFFPPIWVHNRAVVRLKGKDSPDFVIRRIRLGESAQASSLELVPFSLVMSDDDFKQRQAQIEAATLRIPMSKFLDEYDKTGRLVSVTRAPL